jgi:nicotinamide-nucleotide amidase
LEAALQRAEVVLFTGGIGPTKDDITKQTLCKYFGSELVFDADVYADIENLLKNRSRAMNELTATQAMVPEKAIIIRNPIGTAPITWFERNGKVVVSMPGVPYEMKHAMNKSVIPMLKDYFKTPHIVHYNVLVTGYPESALALKIQDWENQLPENTGLAYLPNFNIVKLRLSASCEDEAAMKKIMEDKVTELREILGDAIIAEEDIPAEEILGRLLKSTGKTIATAESCTGGKLAATISSVPGSSAYFKGSIVAYSNEMKINQLGVDERLIALHGAVSREVAEAMAEGVRRQLNASIALATTGIAGPDGGTSEKPVGSVWIAMSTPDKTISRMFSFNLSRQLNVERTVQSGMLMVISEMS